MNIVEKKQMNQGKQLKQCNWYPDTSAVGAEMPQPGLVQLQIQGHV